MEFSPNPTSNKRTEVSPEMKNHIAQFLMCNSVHNVVGHCMIKKAAEKFGISKRTIHRVWVAAKALINEGKPVLFKSNRLGVAQPKTVVLDKERMQRIPFSLRTSIRTLAIGLDVSTSQVGRWAKSGVIKPHTNAIKPELTAKNKQQRLKFTLSALRADMETKQRKFDGMHNTIHIDEKWFYMSRNTERYYMVPEEEEPHRTCKSKRFIPKVMFMCAVSRPLITSEGEVVFDGKIGLWPFTSQEAAKRNSKNRPKGTLETKPLDSVNKEVIKACILNQILPAIKAKWPAGASKNIFIQQDNARPHITNEDGDFRAAASADGFNIQLVCQPANSPDTNVLDLGWFRAIQSLQIETASYTVDELVSNVELSFEKMEATSLNNVFLSLQNCLVEVLKVQGHNKYKQPHMGKARLIREGRLPISLEVDDVLVRESIQLVLEGGNREAFTAELKELLEVLGY